MIMQSDDCKLDSIEFSAVTDGKQPTFVRLEFYNKTDYGRCETEGHNPDKTPKHPFVSIPYCICADHEDHLRYENPKDCERTCNVVKQAALGSTGVVQEADGDRHIDQGPVAIEYEQR